MAGRGRNALTNAMCDIEILLQIIYIFTFQLFCHRRARISEFNTTQKPEGMTIQVSNITNKMFIELKWTPTIDQSEKLHKVCFSAKDSNLEK